MFDFDVSSGFSGEGIYVFDLSVNSSINLNTAIGSNNTLDQSEISWSQDSTRILVYREFAQRVLLSPDGSDMVELSESTSASSVGDLTNIKRVENDVNLVRHIGVSGVSGDILKADKNGQTPSVIANSDPTHAFHCIGISSCNITEFQLSNNANFITYSRVGDSVSSAGDDLHAINLDGSGDVKISIDLDSGLGLRISEYSIQSAI
ncbi:MAG: hypothetical protein ACI8XC_002413 [Gammaproteobacteria bacterium]